MEENPHPDTNNDIVISKYNKYKDLINEISTNIEQKEYQAHILEQERIQYLNLQAQTISKKQKILKEITELKKQSQEIYKMTLEAIYGKSISNLLIPQQIPAILAGSGKSVKSQMLPKLGDEIEIPPVDGIPPEAEYATNDRRMLLNDEDERRTPVNDGLKDEKATKELQNLVNLRKLQYRALSDVNNSPKKNVEEDTDIHQLQENAGIDNVLQKMKQESEIYEHKKYIQDRIKEFDDKQYTPYYIGPISGDVENFTNEQSYQLVLSDSILQGKGFQDKSQMKKKQNDKQRKQNDHIQFQKKIHEQLQQMGGFDNF